MHKMYIGKDYYCGVSNHTDIKTHVACANEGCGTSAVISVSTRGRKFLIEGELGDKSILLSPSFNLCDKCYKALSVTTITNVHIAR